MCGEFPHSGFSPSGRASAHALRSGRMWEAAVRGATGRLQLTAGDFHRQGNPAEVRPVSQRQARRMECGLHGVQCGTTGQNVFNAQIHKRTINVGEVFAHRYFPSTNAYRI
jgi:hypothetical protein